MVLISLYSKLEEERWRSFGIFISEKVVKHWPEELRAKTRHVPHAPDSSLSEQHS